LSMKYSDNSPISPESASSMLVNPSWDASPTFSTMEKIIQIAESPSSPVASRSSHESLPVAGPVSPRKERPLSPKLRNTVQTNNFQGNAALLFGELANQLVGASAATPAAVLRACASSHLTPDPTTNAIHDGGLVPPRFHVEGVQANPHRRPTPSPVADFADRGGPRPRSLRGMLRRTISTVW
jgi:hypothetical protein